MSEKRTFKITSPDDGQILHDTDDGWYACCGHIFELSEWDMEVTFTKKVKPEVGGTATLENYATIFTIIAVSDERVWLQDPNNQAQNFVRRFDQLRNVEPWRPA